MASLYVDLLPEKPFVNSYVERAFIPILFLSCIQCTIQGTGEDVHTLIAPFHSCHIDYPLLTYDNGSNISLKYLRR